MAEEAGEGRGNRRGVCGSVTFCQRYGSLLQLNPHAHTWIPDGVFTEGTDGKLIYHHLGAPDDEELALLCQRICRRVVKRIEAADESTPPESEEEAVMETVQAEVVSSPLRKPLWFEEAEAMPRSSAPLSAEWDGFSLHAGLAVKAKERLTLERLLRYGARPPFAQKRLSLLPSGKVRLKLRKPYYTGQTELVLSPEAFLKRLLAILPPPRWHLTRYHGIEAPHRTRST